MINILYKNHLYSILRLHKKIQKVLRLLYFAYETNISECHDGLIESPSLCLFPFFLQWVPFHNLSDLLTAHGFSGLHDRSSWMIHSSESGWKMVPFLQYLWGTNSLKMPAFSFLRHMVAYISVSILGRPLIFHGWLLVPALIFLSILVPVCILILVPESIPDAYSFPKKRETRGFSHQSFLSTQIKG